ncbi:MAG: 30S ribosomal protein S3 [Planctomycetes bacterium]|nr:30S ribosomal protein S3 [Planctomycetota bacterium]MBI3846665.1 30S ribosomal protein S3 [Planctomycetota bacterium]
MGQKVRPTGLRLGIVENWRSRWYANKKEFPKLLVEDQRIRRYVKREYGFAGIPKIEIERTGEEVKIIIHTARPGVLIGKKGSKIDKLKEDLEGLLEHKRVSIDTKEVTKPDLDAQLVAENVAEQLVKRASFRRTLKKTIQQSMQEGALGIKIRIAGRLGGAEMARVETQGEGKIPLSTLRAEIDYGFAEASTTYGKIGVKVWVYKGEVLAKRR